MKPKTYSVRKHLNQKNKTFFIIDYQVNERVEKQIEFTYLEHYLQFTDLLKQLDYKEVLTNKSIPAIFEK